MNNITIAGRLTRDPELNTTPNGVSVCKFTVAVDRRFDKDTADFFNVTVWRGLADNCGKFLSKGKQVAVNGEMQMHTYETEDGSKRTAWDLQANTVDFLTPKSEQQAPTDIQQPDIPGLTPVDDDEQLPF